MHRTADGSMMFRVVFQLVTYILKLLLQLIYTIHHKLPVHMYSTTSPIYHERFPSSAVKSSTLKLKQTKFHPSK